MQNLNINEPILAIPGDRPVDGCPSLYVDDPDTRPQLDELPGVLSLEVGGRPVQSRPLVQVNHVHILLQTHGRSKIWQYELKWGQIIAVNGLLFLTVESFKTYLSSPSKCLYEVVHNCSLVNHK